MCPAPPSQTTWHMGCLPGDLAPVVVLTTRAEQALALSMQLDSAKMVASRREFISLTGLHKGRPVSICSAGLGAPPVAIVVEEIHQVGGQILIWLGELEPLEQGNTTPEIPEVVVAWAAVRGEYTSQQYVPLPYPALSDPSSAMALDQAAREIGAKAQMGVVLTTDIPATRRWTFLPGNQELEACLQAGVLGREMSVSTLFITARLLGMRAGALLRMVGADTVTDQTLMRVCLNALERLETGNVLAGGENEP